MNLVFDSMTYGDILRVHKSALKRDTPSKAKFLPIMHDNLETVQGRMYVSIIH